MPGNVGKTYLEARVPDVRYDLGKDVGLATEEVARNDASPVTKHALWAEGFRRAFELEMHDGDGGKKAVNTSLRLVVGVLCRQGSSSSQREPQTSSVHVDALAYGCFKIHDCEVIRASVVTMS